jgi:hypothetical protein
MKLDRGIDERFQRETNAPLGGDTPIVGWAISAAI